MINSNRPTHRRNFKGEDNSSKWEKSETTNTFFNVIDIQNTLITTDQSPPPSFPLFPFSLSLSYSFSLSLLHSTPNWQSNKSNDKHTSWKTKHSSWRKNRIFSFLSCKNWFTSTMSIFNWTTKINMFRSNMKFPSTTMTNCETCILLNCI